jgi:hypothetical protein
MAGATVFLAELLHHLEAQSRILLDEIQEIGPWDKLHEAWFCGERGYSTIFPRHRRTQPQRFPCSSDLDDNSFSFFVADREPHSPVADDKDTAGNLTLDKKDRISRIRDWLAYITEQTKIRIGQIAEIVFGSSLAGPATLEEVRSWRQHNDGSVLPKRDQSGDCGYRAL